MSKLSKLVLNCVNLTAEGGTLRIHFPDHYFSKLFICVEEYSFFWVDNGQDDPYKFPRRDFEKNQAIYHKISLEYSGTPDIELFSKPGDFGDFVL